jgi:uncharacterized damage-inducible protein DinB
LERETIGVVTSDRIQAPGTLPRGLFLAGPAVGGGLPLVMTEPLALYDYLALARVRVMDAAATLSAADRARVFPVGLGTIDKTLTHTVMAEWFYLRRIGGLEVPAYRTWPHRYEEPPALEVVRAFWDQQAAETRRVIAGERDWRRRISYLALLDEGEAGPARTITATPAEIFTQLVLHEVHHRSQVMGMLRQLGVVVEDLDFSAMTYARR